MRISDDDMIVALRRAISALVDEKNLDAAVESIIGEMQVESKKSSTLGLLSGNGKILMDLMAHPNSSLQDCADRLGMTSPTIAHVMTHLVGAGLVVRSRVGNKNQYTFCVDSLTKHGDIILTIVALHRLLVEMCAPSGDITPSVAS